MSFSDYPTEIHKGGHYMEDPTIRLYEKTTDAIEEVVGRFGATGTADHQVSLWYTGAQVAGVFLKQRKHLPMVSGKPSSNHAEDGESVDFAASGIALVKLRLKSSQVIVKGNALSPEDATGKAVLRTTGPVGAIAAESVTTTGDDGWILAWLKTPSAADLDT